MTEAMPRMQSLKNIKRGRICALFFFGRHGGVRRPAVFQNLPMMALFPTETAFGKLHKLFPKNFLNFVQFDY